MKRARFGAKLNTMVNTATTSQYQSLYQFLVVLDEVQVHKLHKVVSGMLDIDVFSAAEIEQLQRRLTIAGNPATIVQMTQN